MGDVIHETRIGAVSPVSGEYVESVLVWADRPYSTCDRCGQPVPTVESAPAIANPLGSAMAVSQQHGCGEWLSVFWTELPGDATVEQITQAKHDLLRRYRAAIEERTEEIRAALAADLTEMLELSPDERYCTGSEVEPGIYQESGGYLKAGPWVAWAYAPVGGDAITVYEEDLGKGPAR
ncbi:hypothetical protein [Micromonospora sp. NPDC047730]|uniref:hypothetical protein n=1 Tax=Micromonospora sp. NPDC047730 TaxID=3364253 RepID=UPI003713AF8C